MGTEVKSATNGLTPARELEFEVYWTTRGKRNTEVENAQRYFASVVFTCVRKHELVFFCQRIQREARVLCGVRPEFDRVPDPVRRRTIAALERAINSERRKEVATT